MKAVTRTTYGGPDILSVKEIHRPKPKQNEILVKVKATTVNRTDTGILRGKPYLIRAFVGLRKPRHLTPGTDFSGEVVEVGSSVTEFKTGDRIWGLSDEGLQSQAEFMVIRANKAVVKIPDGINFEDAAASAEGAHYAYNFINKVKLDKTKKVMVYGATGAIGSAAVQLLKHYDCFVTAVGNSKNIDLIKSLGADKVVDYQRSDFTKDDIEYDFIFDAVGKSSFGECKPLMAEKCIYISSELGPGAQNLYYPLLKRFSKRRVVFPVPSKPKRTLEFMNKLLANKEFKPVIEKKHTIDQIKEVYKYVESGEKTGNVVIMY